MIQLFSGLYDALSGAYQKHRPQYPRKMFESLAELCHERRVAWDCATGNGQAAVGLADQFQYVWATDESRKQIQKAKLHPRVSYSQADCKESGLPPNSVDLVCVAQALHWFNDLAPFYQEVARVLRPGGVFAAICYFQPNVSDAIDELVEELYRNEAIGRFWYPGFRHVEDLYCHLPLPFPHGPSPKKFQMSENWTWAQFQGYLRTWAHVASAAKNGKAAALRQVFKRMEQTWGGAQTSHEVTWEVTTHISLKKNDSPS